MDKTLFGSRIKELRERKHMSAPELAEASGLSYPYLWKLERGDLQPSWQTVQALADALDVSTEELRTNPG